MGSEAVKVIVRCRPMNEREEKLNCGVSCILKPTIILSMATAKHCNVYHVRFS